MPRIWFSGPRILGVRTGISFGPSDFARAARAKTPALAVSPKPIDTLVYVIASASGAVKIGISGDPLARLAQLQTASALPLELVYAAAVESGDGFPIEQAAHDLLARHRQAGEWFDVSPDMAVAAIAGAAHKIGQPIIEVPRNKLRAVLELAAQRRAAPASSPEASPTAPRTRRSVVALYWTLPIATLLACAGLYDPGPDPGSFLIGAAVVAALWFALVYGAVLSIDRLTGKSRA